MKRFLTSAIIAAVAAAANAQGFGGAPAAPNISDRVVGYDQVMAVVEDTTITREDLMQALSPFMQKLRDSSRSKEEFQRQFEQLSREMLQELVDRVIIVKDFYAQGMMIPNSIMDGIFEDDLKKSFNGDRSEFLKYLQSQNKTIKQYRKEQMESVIVNHMQSKQRLTASEVSPAKIIEYYNENKQKWYTPETVKVSQITLRDDSPELLKEKAAKVEAEIKGGLDFAEAAKKYSQDEYAKGGGESGWYTKGQFNALLDKVIFLLEPGQTGEPVFISNYAYILKVDEKKKEGIQPLDDVREKIEWTIAADNARIEYQKWLERLRKKSYIRYY